MATFSCSWTTTSTTATITARFSGGDSSFSGTRYVRIYLNDILYAEPGEISSGGSTTITYTISNLSSNTTYDYYVYLGYKATGESSVTWLEDYYSDSGSFTTDSTSISIDYWSWSSSNGHATAEKTKTAYTAIKNKGPLSDFSYMVWNDMVSKVDDILYLTGNDWDETYASYADTTMSTSDKKMTAVRYNSLRNNIRLKYYVSETRYPIAKKGEVVKGEYFITIAEVINEWIDTL